jgi:hypothetical protein
LRKVADGDRCIFAECLHPRALFPLSWAIDKSRSRSKSPEAALTPAALLIRSKVMASDSTEMSAEDEVLFKDPRRFLIVAMVATVIPIFLTVPYSPVRDFLVAGAGKTACLLLLFVGAVAAGCAVAARPRSPTVLGLGALIALLNGLGFRALGWDSAEMLLFVLAGMAALAALIMLLPQAWRRVAVSVLIVLHFGGILTAVASAPPGVWLANQLWATFYCRYLQFMYLNNAYHFYAPEPGPAGLLWFLVEYERNIDGTKNWRWVKVPDFDHDGTALRPEGTRLWPKVEYTRRLSLVEGVSMPDQGANLQEAIRGRITAGNYRGIPLHPELNPEQQYRPIAELSKQWLRSYVRHVARTYKNHDRPELQITGIKVYRVIHGLLGPGQMAMNVRPDDPLQYMPFYLGEYDKDGNVKPYEELAAPGPDQNVKVADPFLYWLIPILPMASTKGTPQEHGDNGKVTNYVYVHANVDDRGELP